MISIYQNRNMSTTGEGEEKEIQIRGLSTDTKPTTLGDNDMPNGAIFLEINTGKIFFFDGDSKTWKEA